MTAVLVLAVAVASALGAVARFVVDAAVRAVVSRSRAARGPHPVRGSSGVRTSPSTDGSRLPVPWGIGLVNASGALVLGLVTGLAVRGGVGEDVVTVAGVGFLGSYTTFSTFAVDVVRLWTTGRRTVAMTNVVLTLVLGIALAATGYAITS